jgi:hypothetical protein
MKKIISFIRISLWFAIWFAFLALLIEVFVNKKTELYKVDLSNIKMTNLLLESVFIDRKQEILEKTFTLKTAKLTPKGQKIVKEIAFLQHITDSTSQIIEQLDFKNPSNLHKAKKILHAFKKQINDFKNLDNLGYLFSDYYYNYFMGDTQWLFLLRNRPDEIYKMMELQPKILLHRLHYEIFRIYYGDLEKERLDF